MNITAGLLAHGDDTIAALATAKGRGATALIRISGPRTLEIIRVIVRSPLPPARRVALVTLFEFGDGDAGALDQCLLTIFPGPASYTGEDCAELSVHGGETVPALVLATLTRAGARAALPGEFTRRAMLNGKIDLLQAEAVADLVDARSRGAATAALKQLDGGLTRRIAELRSAIVEVEAMIAYDIDFPEEDDGPIEKIRITDACSHVISQLSTLLATAATGEMLRVGALVVIAGAPNAGKSSLFNALVGRRRSLVTDIPGTTRDAIEAIIDADEWTLRLVDTAGLRDTNELVERLGIEVAEEYLSQAQVVLVCGDNPEDLGSALYRSRKLTTAPLIAVRTKVDLDDVNAHGTRPYGEAPVASAMGPVAGEFAISALSGEGLAQLISGIGYVLRASNGNHASAPLLLRARHERAVAEALLEMQLFMNAFVEDTLPMSVAGTHLRAASNSLESLIGAVAVDDVLDVLFRSFCVGK